MKKIAVFLLAFAALMPKDERSVTVSTASLEWKPITLAAIPKGLRQKVLPSDAKGNSSAIIQFPKGYREPRHFHKTCTHTIYVLKGRLKSPGGDLIPGSFAYAAAGEAHGPFTAVEETEILFHTDGEFDYHVEEAQAK